MEALGRDVQALCAAGRRDVGSRGHAAARTHLLARMKELGLEPYRGRSFELPYGSHRRSFVNLVGRLPGRDAHAPALLLAAHYDTAGPRPGADDNAAAVAVLLSLVEKLRAHPLPCDVLFAFFDAEEPPHWLTPRMGSTWFYENQREGEIACALVLDLIGHDVPIPGYEDLVFALGMESDTALPEAVRACGDTPGLRLLPTLNRYVAAHGGDLSDHHVFRLHDRPYLFLTCGQWEHYHRPTDTPEKLNYAKMEAVARLVESLVVALAGRAFTGPAGHDTTPVELAFFRRHLGALAARWGMELEDRADIDRMVERVLMEFGLLAV